MAWLCVSKFGGRKKKILQQFAWLEVPEFGTYRATATSQVWSQTWLSQELIKTRKLMLQVGWSEFVCFFQKGGWKIPRPRFSWIDIDRCWWIMFFLFWNQTNHDVYYFFWPCSRKEYSASLLLQDYFWITKSFGWKVCGSSQSWWAETCIQCIQIQESRMRLTPRWMKNPLSGCWIRGGCDQSVASQSWGV